MYYYYNGINMYYEKYGNKNKNIIILPGWGNNRCTFNYMINYLKDYATIYIMDYPGFGNSSFPNYDLSIYDYATLIHEWIKSLNISNPILIGHSFGGRIITILLGYYKYNYKSVIYLNSAGIRHKKRLRTLSYKVLKSFKYILPKRLRSIWIKYLFNKYASSDYKNISPNISKTFKNVISTDLKKYLKSIKARVLIIWGYNDLDTKVKDAYIMNKYIKNSELIVINNSNHFTYLNYPDLINSIIYEQIKEEII